MLRNLVQSHTPRRLYQHIPLSRRYLSTQRPPRSRKWLPITAGGLFAGLASLYFFIPDPSRGAPTSSRTPLSAHHFTPATVLSNEVAGPNTRIIKLKVPPHLIPKTGEDPIGFEPIWSVFIKDDDIQVERQYTPLEGIDEDGNMMFWIKRYPKGEVGKWLHSKRQGESIELRGPLKTWPWKEGEWDEIILISGGTGITPFYQLIRNVFEHTEGNLRDTRLTLVHGSRTPEELPPPHVLGPLITYAEKYPDKFRLKLLVDEDDGSKAPLPTPPLEEGRLTDQHVKQILGVPEPTRWERWFGKKDVRPTIPSRTLFLVCGPDPMIAAVAGPYGRNLSQGPTLGILGKLGVTPRQVFKL